MEGKKRSIQSILKGDDNNGDKVYKFQVLLPNGISVQLIKRNPVQESLSLDVIVESLKERSVKILQQMEPSKRRTMRKVLWGSKDLYLEDALGNRLRSKLCFDRFKPNKVHYLRLFDGAGDTVDTFENMWDLTPDTDLLTELPDDYTFETALADLIDNSLQAVWSNSRDERKLISIEIHEDRVTIFDTGPGMDGSGENSIVKWGKMGASVHRSSKIHAIGGKPPYLKPFFGMFGYGGTIASMHLGRHAVVSAKTKESKKVYWLRLERDTLLKRSGSTLNWKAAGGIRDPLDNEIEESPHGSFTKIDMKPKLKLPDISQLRCKLKDIYFPYIQCDEISKAGRTTTLVEFQVNGTNLAEIDGGEVAITNLHSSNGPDFVLNLHFSIEDDEVAAKSPSGKGACEANARLKCVYFPVIEGKESIERILEKLKADGFEIKEDFESFSRICIRRLGRLLPDSRWELLPFMKPKQKRGDKVHILKICCLRVKCFIDTDAGFTPLQSKTDLALHHPFTKTLKDLGNDTHQKEKGVKVEIHRDGKQLSISQLEKEYQNWILQMHSQYDLENNCGGDEPVLLVNPSNKEALGFTSDVVRVHQAITRKGTSLKRGQKIKILKGACAGFHNKNVFATLEYFLLEGFEGDAGGEGRIICRPLGVQDQDGCVLTVDDTSTRLELHSSVSLPITVIDSGKCVPVGNDDWNCQLEKLTLKMPSTIEVLGCKQCKELDIDGALPAGATVSAGLVPPKEVVAVLRPSNFTSNSTNNVLDQKYIVRDNHEMCMDVKFKAETAKPCKIDHIYSGSVTNTSRKGCHGLYIFPLGSVSSLFHKAGEYSFSFSLKNSACTSCEVIVRVEASSKVERWELLKDDQNLQFHISAGSCFPPFSVTRYDLYGNRVPFKSIPEIMIRLTSNGIVLAHVKKMKVELSLNKSCMIVKNVQITARQLDKIRPSYEATLVLSLPDKQFILSIPCQVVPGPLQSVMFHPSEFCNSLLPKQVVEDIKLEMFDRYGNHVKEGTEVELAVHGFAVQDNIGLKRKVDDLGFIDLSGLLKVTGGYGSPVSLYVKSDKEPIFTKKFQVEKRELRIATEVPELCRAGSKLKDLAFEVVNSKGDVDKTIHDDDKHGKPHTLKVKSEFSEIDDSLRYAFRHGRCVVPSITLPHKEGSFWIEAIHSHHRELHFKFKVTVSGAVDMEEGMSSDLQASEEQQDDETCQFLDEEVITQPVYLDEINLSTASLSVQEDVSEPLIKEDTVVISPLQVVNEECEEHISQSSSPTSENLPTLTGSQSQNKKVTLAETPSEHDDTNVEHDNDMFQSPEGKIITADPFTPEQYKMLMGPQVQDLEKEVLNYALLIKECEEDMKLVEANRVTCDEDLSRLQDESQLMSQKEVVLGKIEKKFESPAAVYSAVSKNTSSFKGQDPDELMTNVVGLVAVLATAPTRILSCVLAEYLGEDLMLAMVCQSSASVIPPEKYEVALNSLAAKLGKSIKGSQFLICLEDIRACSGEVDKKDPQRKLVLPKPLLSDGRTPQGFLGYAVNLINIDIDHLLTTTARGHGLRETLFYRLFGELQVYETKEYMKQALPCIRDGAVSLDGEIMRGNGIFSLGRRKMREAEVQFPVIGRSKMMREMEKDVVELRKAKEASAYLQKKKERYKKQFEETQGKLLKVYDDKEESIVSQQPLKVLPSESPTQ